MTRACSDPLVQKNENALMMLLLVFFAQLGGFELAQTQTTLKKLSKGKAHSTTLCYTCPQNLENINHTYSKECEMYR